jgi:hypothetical protein
MTHKSRGHTPIEERDAEWYAKSANRFNRAEARRFPLLAALGATKTYTGEERREEVESATQRIERMETESDARFLGRAAAFRASVAERVTPEQLAELDDHVRSPTRQHYMKQPCYLADFWHTTERRVSEGLPPMEGPWMPLRRTVAVEAEEDLPLFSAARVHRFSNQGADNDKS